MGGALVVGGAVAGGVLGACADALIACQVPPKDLIPSPLAWPFDVSPAKRYRGRPRSVTCSLPSRRCSRPRRPSTPPLAASFTLAERTVSGTQISRQVCDRHS